MSVVSQVVLHADDELRYPSAGELKTLAEFFQTGKQRMQIASTLAGNERRIVDLSSSQLWQKQPDFIAPTGNPRAIANDALLSDEDATEAAPYLDYIIQAMS